MVLTELKTNLQMLQNRFGKCQNGNIKINVENVYLLTESQLDQQQFVSAMYMTRTTNKKTIHGVTDDDASTFQRNANSRWHGQGGIMQ